jgi:hypothetical protein
LPPTNIFHELSTRIYWFGLSATCGRKYESLMRETRSLMRETRKRRGRDEEEPV